MNAMLFCQEQQQRELHDLERPVASLTSLLANSNRNSKKQPKPFGPDDFYWYKNIEQGKYPGARYGAAAMEMMRLEVLPSWALFVYKDLKVMAKDAMPPEPLYLVHEDAIILGPSFSDGMVHGMLIAQHSCSEKTLTMKDPEGESVRVLMPRVGSAFFAEEDISLKIYG